LITGRMGNCCESPKTDEERAIDAKMGKAESQDKKTKKLLFLGAGGSGKSTLFKQLQVIHAKNTAGAAGGADEGLKVEVRSSYKDLVSSNIVSGLKALIEGIDDPEMGRFIDYIDGLKDEAKIADCDIPLLKEFWATKQREKAWKNRGPLQVQDNLLYFMTYIDRIVGPQYIPTIDDVMNVRSRTTGIMEKKLTINKHPFLVVDVGGQRNERRKWMHSFDGVTAVIFVAALSAYDQTLYEDDEVNRMQESLQLFEDILKLKTFKGIDVILFLNKADLFKDKLSSGIPITKAFPKCTDPGVIACEFKTSYTYIKGQFKARNKTPQERQIFMHMTCATNSKMIEQIFNDVQHLIVQNSLKKAGLLAY